MFQRRLSALGYPQTESFRGESEREACALAAWLEDKIIRQYAIEDRGPLRNGDAGALQAYLLEMHAPPAVASHLQARRYQAVSSWLLCVALQYEHDEKRSLCDEAARRAKESASSRGLSADDSELLGLAAAYGVTPCSDANRLLQDVLRASRAARAPAPQEQAAPPVKKRKPPLAPLGEGTFPLGFSLEDDSLNDAARVLRILYVRELRQLQDAVNDAIVSLQELTANPKTDAGLGRVGR